MTGSGFSPLPLIVQNASCGAILADLHGFFPHVRKTWRWIECTPVVRAERPQAGVGRSDAYEVRRRALDPPDPR